MPPNIERLHRRLGLLVVAFAVVAWLVGRPGPGGVLVGGGFVALSVWSYRWLFTAVIATGHRRLALAITFVKVAALAGLGWWMLANDAVDLDPLGFALGVTSLPVAAVWEAIEVKG